MRLFKSLVFCLAAFCSSVFAEAMPDFPFINVSGQASLKVEPNKVDISFTILSFDKNAEVALDNVGAASQKVMKYLLGEGLQSKQITSYNVSKDSKRARDRDTYQSLEILGYELKQRFEVELLDLDKFESIVNTLLQTQYVEGLSMNFGHTERKSYMRELTKKAGSDAKQKAQDLAAGVGVELGSVFAVNESGRDMNLSAGFNMKASHVAEMRMRKPVFNLPEFIELQKSIQVMYRIR